MPRSTSVRRRRRPLRPSRFGSARHSEHRHTAGSLQPIEPLFEQGRVVVGLDLDQGALPTRAAPAPAPDRRAAPHHSARRLRGPWWIARIQALVELRPSAEPADVQPDRRLDVTGRRHLGDAGVLGRPEKALGRRQSIVNPWKMWCADRSWRYDDCSERREQTFSGTARPASSGPPALGSCRGHPSLETLSRSRAPE